MQDDASTPLVERELRTRLVFEPSGFRHPINQHPPMMSTIDCKPNMKARTAFASAESEA